MAVRSLADSLLALSATVNEANQGLRQRLQLDALEDPPALEGPAGEPADPAALPGPRKNGRAKANA